jgi:hypothetical protein
MYRPGSQGQQGQQGQQQASIRSTFFGERNYHTLQTVLAQDVEQRQGGVALTPQQNERLSKTLDHYLEQVYQKQGEKPLPVLNKEVLGACAKDFSQYMQRKEVTKQTNTVKTVMDDGLYQETSQRFERITQERNDVKALPPAIPDFRVSLSEDGPPAAVMFERAKKQRELEMLRSSQQNSEAEAGLLGRIQADSSFRAQQDAQNRTSELAVMQRQQGSLPSSSDSDLPLVVLPDRRELLLAPIGSFDTMTQSPGPRELGQANSNPTTIHPSLASPMIDNLPQNMIIREEKVMSYREVENNLFIYSADRDWLRNNKENRYSFTVNFDPAANGQNFGPNLASQQKFKNIVRIELVKAIMPGESLSVTVNRTLTQTTGPNTNYQDNILNLPYVILRVGELENNNYGTDNFLDRGFGVLQYDAQWVSDVDYQKASTRGFLAMIPKFMKCQKEYYPTPLSTLQKMTIDIRRPNGELVSTSPDTFDIGGILAPQTGTNEVLGPTFPFNNAITVTQSPDLTYNVLLPPPTYFGSGTSGTLADGDPANFFINTVQYFNKFQMCPGDRIQISGYTYTNAALTDPTYGSTLRDFCGWINRPEGHIVLAAAYSSAFTNANNLDTKNLTDGFNEVGYANFIIIQARYQDPSTGSVCLQSFGPNFGGTLNAFGAGLQSPVRLINLNKQLNVVFRIITREMDALPQLRPDNNY